MSSSKSGNAPFSSFSSGPRSFQSKNLNNTLKPQTSAPAVRDVKPSSSNLKGGMAVLVGKKQLTKSIGAAATPVPINTPSLRSEIRSKEPWGGATSTPTSGTVAPGSGKLASWAKDEQDPNVPSTTTKPAERGRNWALRDDDSEDDGDSPLPGSAGLAARRPDTDDAQADRNWGRENYVDDAPEYGQRSRGNSDMYRYQSRYNRDGNDDDRRSGHREYRGRNNNDYGDNNHDHRYNADRRFPHRENNNYSQGGGGVGGRYRANSEDLDHNGGGSSWRRHTHDDGYEGGGNGSNSSNHYNNNNNHRGRGGGLDDEDGRRGRRAFGGDGHDAQQGPAGRNGVAGPGGPRLKPRSGSFGGDHHNHVEDNNFQSGGAGRRDRSGSFAQPAGSTDDTAGAGAAAGGWSRITRPTGPPGSVSAGGKHGSTGSSQQQPKVNQVNSALVRPNRDGLLPSTGQYHRHASPSTTVPSNPVPSGNGGTPMTAMKVLTKHNAGAILESTSQNPHSEIATTAALAQMSGDDVGSNNNGNVSGAAAAGGGKVGDGFGKTFASMLSQYDKNLASGLTRESGGNADAVRDGRGGDDDYEEEEEEEYHDDSYHHNNHNSNSNSRRRPLWSDPPSHQQDDVRSRFNLVQQHNEQVSHSQHHQQHSRAASAAVSAPVLPPRRKGGLLFEPKSGQFVEDARKTAEEDSGTGGGGGNAMDYPHQRHRKYSEASSHGGESTKNASSSSSSAKHNNSNTVRDRNGSHGGDEKGAEGDSLAGGGRWAKVSVIKRGLAEDGMQQKGRKGGDWSHTASASATVVLTPAQEEEQRRQAEQEAKRIKRIQERLTRAPRTKGKLYRLNATTGEVELVPDNERVWDESVRSKLLEEVSGGHKSTTKEVSVSYVDRSAAVPVGSAAESTTEVAATAVHTAGAVSSKTSTTGSAWVNAKATLEVINQHVHQATDNATAEKNQLSANADKESPADVVPSAAVAAVVPENTTINPSSGVDASSSSSSSLSQQPPAAAVMTGTMQQQIPTTPRQSELVATANIFTPSQPLLASLQQQQQQQQSQQHQPPSMSYPGLVMADGSLPLGSPPPQQQVSVNTPGATLTPSGMQPQQPPPPPMFLSSPGMSNVLFGPQSHPQQSLNNMQDMFAFNSMNSNGFNNMGMMGTNMGTMYNFGPHHSHPQQFAMMPAGFMMDTNSNTMYGFDPRFNTAASGTTSSNGLGWMGNLGNANSGIGNNYNNASMLSVNNANAMWSSSMEESSNQNNAINNNATNNNVGGNNTAQSTGVNPGNPGATAGLTGPAAVSTAANAVSNTNVAVNNNNVRSVTDIFGSSPMMTAVGVGGMMHPNNSAAGWGYSGATNSVVNSGNNINNNVNNNIPTRSYSNTNNSNNLYGAVVGAANVAGGGDDSSGMYYQMPTNNMSMMMTAGNGDGMFGAMSQPMQNMNFFSGSTGGVHTTNTTNATDTIFSAAVGGSGSVGLTAVGTGNNAGASTNDSTGGLGNIMDASSVAAGSGGNLQQQQQQQSMQQQAQQQVPTSMPMMVPLMGASQQQPQQQQIQANNNNNNNGFYGANMMSNYQPYNQFGGGYGYNNNNNNNNNLQNRNYRNNNLNNNNFGGYDHSNMDNNQYGGGNNNNNNYYSGNNGGNNNNNAYNAAPGGYTQQRRSSGNNNNGNNNYGNASYSNNYSGGYDNNYHQR